jgi:hypothetical protein
VRGGSVTARQQQFAEPEVHVAVVRIDRQRTPVHLLGTIGGAGRGMEVTDCRHDFDVTRVELETQFESLHRARVNVIAVDR